MENVNPFVNNFTSSVVDSTIYVNQGVEEISMDVNLATLYRGYGIISGGLDGQVLFKSGSENYKTQWKSLSTDNITGFNTWTGSVDDSINSLNSFTGSVNTNALNEFSASVNIWTGSVSSSLNSLNLYTSSNTIVLNNFYVYSSSMNIWTGSVNTSIINVNNSLNSYTSSNNVNILNLNQFSSSINIFTSSVNSSLNSLNINTGSVSNSLNSLNNFTSSFSSSFINFSASVSNSKENYLGHPVGDGYILSSAVNGVRTWIPSISAATWGNITGSLPNQLDLQNVLNLKSPLINPIFTSSLTVFHSGSTDLTIGTSGTTTLPSLNFRYNTLAPFAKIEANIASGEVKYYATTNYFPTFYANNSEAMRITTGGIVLIGTTISTGKKFEVVGNGKFSSTLEVGTNMKLNTNVTFIDTEYINTGVYNDRNYGRIIFQTGNGARTPFIIFSNGDAKFGIGSATVTNSCVFEIESTSKGLLIPRMTTTQRDAISSPAEGLKIYNLTTHTEDFYNGTVWKTITTN